MIFVQFQIESLHRLQHANIIELFGYGQSKIDNFVVMEFMDDGSLDDGM